MKKAQSSKLKVQSLKVKIIYFFFLISCFSFAVCSFAVAGGGEEEGGASLFKEYGWPVINFLILLALLVFFMKKMDIKSYFRKRTELIEKSLEEARQARELAEKALAEVEEKLKVKDREVAEIIAAARQSGEKEKAKLVEESARLKENIIEQAKTNIDYELKSAKEAIKAEAVEIAMELAEKKLKDKMTKEEQLRLLEESIAKIEGGN